MRIYLVSPSHYQADSTLYKMTQCWTSAITLPYLKALTPPGHEVVCVDEMMDTVDLWGDYDLVGITAMGPQVVRAYDLADHFRRRGIQVILGGTWVSLNPDEALAHCDAVCVGEAELVWDEILADAESRSLKPRYESSAWHDLRNLPPIDYRTLPLLDFKRFSRDPFYRMYFHWPVVTTRGCSHKCSYCAVQTYYHGTVRTRPVDEVLEDFRAIKALGGWRVLILDDNPISNPGHAKELFRQLIPLKMQWASQCTINIARNDELLDLAARSGCKVLTIGFESISRSMLKRYDKSFNKPERYAEDIRKIREKGIQVVALLMVGLDGDDGSDIDETVAFLRQHRVAALKVFTPCPFPGTKYFEELDSAGRILTKDWSRYDYGSALIRPTHQTTEEMLAGHAKLYRDFYSLGSIAYRFSKPVAGSRLESFFWVIANLKFNRILASQENMPTISG